MIESVHSRLTTPTYAVADAARLVGMTPGRVSRSGFGATNTAPTVAYGAWIR